MRVLIVAVLVTLMGLVSVLIYARLRIKSFLYFFIGVLVSVFSWVVSPAGPYDTIAAGIALLASGWSLARTATIDRYPGNLFRVLLSQSTETARAHVSQARVAPNRREIFELSAICFVMGLAILYLRPGLHPIVVYCPFLLGIQLLAAYFLYREKPSSASP